MTYSAFHEEVYDLIGVGFGPANIALAIALDEGEVELNQLYLDKRTSPNWMSGMLLDGVDIQHNPLRDLATPRNPRSRYGYLSYLHEKDRLFDFLNLGAPYPPRADYAAYVRWAAGKFSHCVRYGKDVTSIKQVSATGDPKSAHYEVVVSDGSVFRCRTLVLAPGRSLNIPSKLENLPVSCVVHSHNYLELVQRLEANLEKKRIAVIGGSQSAIEVILDLSKRFPRAEIHNVQRGFGFRLKDTSPFTEHIYFPEFVDEFYASDPETRRKILKDFWRSNYGAADSDVIHQLYMRLYEEKISGEKSIYIHAYSDIEQCRLLTGDAIEIQWKNRLTFEESTLEFDAVIAATGYKNFGAAENQEIYHPLLSEVAHHLRQNSDGSLAISRNYQLESGIGSYCASGIFLNGLNEATHGFGDAGSFSLLSLRSQALADEICKVLFELDFAQRQTA
ncbi:SidA/IucD/PvdA family monooxygenase [Roseibium sp. M-1]